MDGSTQYVAQSSVSAKILLPDRLTHAGVAPLMAWPTLCTLYMQCNSPSLLTFPNKTQSPPLSRRAAQTGLPEHSLSVHRSPPLARKGGLPRACVLPKRCGRRLFLAFEICSCSGGALATLYEFGMAGQNPGIVQLLCALSSHQVGRLAR